MAKVLTTFFHHDGFLDVVPSDVAAGIVLLRLQQRQRRRNFSKHRYPCPDGIIASTYSSVPTVDYGLYLLTTSASSDLEEGRLGGRLDNSCESPSFGILRRPLSAQNIVSNAFASSYVAASSSGSDLNRSSSSSSGNMSMSGRRYIEMSHVSVGHQHGDQTSAPSSPERDTDIAGNIVAHVDASMLPMNETTLFLLSDMARYCTFAIAIYTHLLAIYMYPCSGFCRICLATTTQQCNTMFARCCCLRTSGQGSTSSRRVGQPVAANSNTTRYTNSKNNNSNNNILGDNYLGLNYTGLSVVTDQLKGTELAFVSFKNDVHNKPYGVFIDREKSAVIIAIRGTLSIEDCITDSICASEEVISYIG